LRKGAALPELGAMAAVLACPRAELDRRTMAPRSQFRRRSERRRAAIRAAVLKGAAPPFAPPF
jgi:hypothetical protein